MVAKCADRRIGAQVDELTGAQSLTPITQFGALRAGCVVLNRCTDGSTLLGGFFSMLIS
jgi:hypothetical protein